MKIRYILLIGLVTLLGLNYLARSSSEAYEACVKAGVQSNDTCRYYAYQ